MNADGSNFAQENRNMLCVDNDMLTLPACNDVIVNRQRVKFCLSIFVAIQLSW